MRSAEGSLAVFVSQGRVLQVDLSQEEAVTSKGMGQNLAPYLQGNRVSLRQQPHPTPYNQPTKGILKAVCETGSDGQENEVKYPFGLS